MTCNYRNRINSITRWALEIENRKVKEIPISEEEFVKVTFKQYDIEIVTQKDKLINALKQGYYVIGVDYNPFILQNVFHYEKGMIDFLKFADVGEHIMAPLRLERDSTILLPKADSSSWKFFVDNLPHYDDFIVYRKGNLLDTESIPPSIASLIKRTNCEME